MEFESKACSAPKQEFTLVIAVLVEFIENYFQENVQGIAPLLVFLGTKVTKMGSLLPCKAVPTGYWPKIKIQLLMSIEFGMPSMQCKKFGICQMVPLLSKGIIQQKKGRNSVAIVTIYAFDHIEIDFFKSSLNDSTYNRFFLQNFFLVKETFLYTSAEEPSHNYRIGTGAYPIHENNSLIKVIFKS